VPPPQHAVPVSSRVARAVVLAGTPQPYRWLMLLLLVVSLGLLSVAAVPLRALPARPGTVAFAERRAHLALAGISLLCLLAIVIALT
jgi:hypothetical protein